MGTQLSPRVWGCILEANHAPRVGFGLGEIAAGIGNVTSSCKTPWTSLGAKEMSQSGVTGLNIYISKMLKAISWVLRPSPGVFRGIGFG